MNESIAIHVDTKPSSFGSWLHVPNLDGADIIFLFTVAPHRGGREYVGTLPSHQLYAKNLPKLLEGRPKGTTLVVIPANSKDFLTVATVKQRPAEGETS